jgi:hypothetical protein
MNVEQVLSKLKVGFSALKSDFSIQKVYKDSASVLYKNVLQYAVMQASCVDRKMCLGHDATIPLIQAFSSRDRFMPELAIHQAGQIILR